MVRTLLDRIAHTTGQLSLYVKDGDGATFRLMRANSRLVREAEMALCGADADLCRAIERIDKTEVF